MKATSLPILICIDSVVLQLKEKFGSGCASVQWVRV